MRRAGWIAICLVSAIVPLAARAQEPVSATVCGVLREPGAFAGKIVKLRATVVTGFEASLIVEPDKSCERGMWFEYAREKEEQSNDLDGRDALLQQKQPVFLLKDDGFQKFEDALGAEVYPRHENSFCMTCPRYKVTAMMVGRVDVAGEKTLGFGHMNMARVRFVMAAVSDVSTVENSYDWEKYSRTPIRFPHGTIQGTITDLSGNPVHFAEVEAVPVEGKIPISNPRVSTQEDGTYSLDVKPGRYLIVVNRDHPATKAIPMDATYFPSQERRDLAQMISVADFQTVKEINIHPVRVLSEKHLRVRVIWPDGKPVEDANVNVAEEGNGYAIAGDDEGGVKHTDKDGWVTLLAYAEKSYRLYADIYKKPGYVPYCEDVFALPADFRDGLKVTMVLRRQSESCRGQWDEAAKPLPHETIAQ